MGTGRAVGFLARRCVVVSQTRTELISGTRIRTLVCDMRWTASELCFGEMALRRHVITSSHRVQR